MLKKINDGLASFLTVVASALLIGIVLCVLLAVLDRTIIRYGFFWTEELARILFVWFSMIAPGIMAAKEQHFQVTFFFDKLFKGKGKEIASIFIVIMVIVTLVIFAYHGTQLAILVAPQKLMTLRKVSMSWFYVSLPIGMTIMAFINVLLLADKIINLFCKKPNPKEEGA